MRLHDVRGWICLLAMTLGILTMPGPAVAAQITTDVSGEVTVITLLGTLYPSDGQQFADAVANVRKAIVLFSSNGGSVAAGLRIGKFIRMRAFATAVPDGVLCASACALAWLGGASRFMGSDAAIGFHAAYRSENGVNEESGVANALVGAYLNSLGLPEQQ